MVSLPKKQHPKFDYLLVEAGDDTLVPTRTSFGFTTAFNEKSHAEHPGVKASLAKCGSDLGANLPHRQSMSTRFTY
jgi:hypothetical protein